MLYSGDRISSNEAISISKHDQKSLYIDNMTYIVQDALVNDVRLFAP